MATIDLSERTPSGALRTTPVVGASAGFRETCVAEKPNDSKYVSTSSAQELQRKWRLFSNDLKSLPKRTSCRDVVSENKYSESESRWLEAVSRFICENGFPDFQLKERFWSPHEEITPSAVIYIYDRCVQVHKILGRGNPQQILALLNELSSRTESRQEIGVDVEAMKMAISSMYSPLLDVLKELADSKESVKNAERALIEAQATTSVQTTDDEDDWESLADDHIKLAEEEALKLAQDVVKETHIKYGRILGELKSNIRIIMNTSTLTRDEKKVFFRSIRHPILLEMNDVLPPYVIDELKMAKKRV